MKAAVVPGVDGVGVTSEGRRVYFGMLCAPFGTMGERAAVASLKLPIPGGKSDAHWAAIMNPALSGWLALTLRARLVPGETVLVLGASGAAGGICVQLARRLGAARVIAAGRNAAALSRLLHVGADATVKLDTVDASAAIADAAGSAGIDVIIDYVWGAPTEAAIAAVFRLRARRAIQRVRLVQVGESAAAQIALPADVLRGAGLEVLGSGIGSIPMAEIGATMPALLAEAQTLELVVDEVPLADVTQA